MIPDNERPIRVLHVIPAVAPRYGGPSQAVINMCRALVAAGVDAEIATTDADGDGRFPRAWASSPYEGISTHFFPRRGGDAFKWSPELARWLMANVARYDIVHVHAVYSHSSLAAWRACRATRTPFVLRPLGSLDPHNVRQKAIRKKVLWALGVGRMIRDANRIHYTAEPERTRSETVIGIRPASVVGLGVDPDLLADEVAPSPLVDPYVLTLCRLHPQKGLERLIEGFSLAVERTDVGWQLVVGGTGPQDYVAALNNRAAALGIGSRLHFVGWLNVEDRARYLRAADLFALTSHQESFGLAVAEAMAVGTPVLVTEGVNLSHAVREAAAGWVSEGSPESIAATLEQAFSGDRAKAGRNGRSLVKTGYTWEGVASELRGMYRDVIGRPRAATVVTAGAARAS